MSDSKLSQLARTAKDYAPLIFQIGSILVLLLSAFVASRIAPIARNNELNALQIQAMQATLDERAPLVDKLLVTEQRVNNLDSAIMDIKNSQIRMEGKLDSFIIREVRQ